MSDSNKKERISYLVDVLNKASKAYYDEADEIMTNYEYDALYDELLLLEEETGFIRDDSPSVNVGYEVRTSLPKVTHESKMLSLNKTKDNDEIATWLGDKTGLLSWKLDGLTVVLTYEKGLLKQAVTRGNGIIGEDVTPNVKVCKNVPKKIEFTGKLVVRGEAVIKYSDFTKINEAILDADAKYKNPRNLCSGSLRQLDSSITANRNVYVYIFSLASVSGEDFGNSRDNQMKWLSEIGFDTVDYRIVNRAKVKDEIENYRKEIADFDIPSDGLVLTYDDIEYSSTLGTTAKFPRDAIAFKWEDQQADTRLLDIEWSPSRSGLLNPIAVFEPVELEGTTVSRASVHNVSIAEKLELGIGDVVRVYKANMIIPQISDNITRSGLKDVPSHCPVCGSKTRIDDEKGTRTLRCDNPECPAKNVKKMVLFVSKDAMNIDGLSESGILKLMGKGFIHSWRDIFEISKHKDDIVTMEGFGEKSYNNLISSIDKARNTTPARLLYSLGIPGIGVVNAGAIAKACRNKWNEIINLHEKALLEIDGIGDILSKDYVKFFNDENNKNDVNKLVEELQIDESYEDTGKKLEGKLFVITGSLKYYENRSALKREIETQGGKVTGTVTSKTDYLITNDISSGSSKNKMAAELNIPIIDEIKIMDMLDKSTK